MARGHYCPYGRATVYPLMARTPRWPLIKLSPTRYWMQAYTDGSELNRYRRNELDAVAIAAGVGWFRGGFPPMGKFIVSRQ